MGVGPRKHAAGFGGIDAEEEREQLEGIWIVERRSGDDWTEIERTMSRADAEAALDQIAASASVDLGDLRLRELD